MHQQFDLRLCQYTLYVWLGIAGMLASIAAAVLVASILPQGMAQAISLFVVAGTGFYGVYKLLKKTTIRAALLTVENDQLTVRYLATGEMSRVVFAEVVSYRDEWLRDGRELRFRLRSDKKIKLATNNFLVDAGDYDGLVQAVQRAIVQFNAICPQAITREKRFFEKPFATVLLVVYSALLLCAASAILIGHKPFQGGFLPAVAAWFTYFGMWRTGRSQLRG